MATVKLRGNMAKGHKIFGSDFGDRVIIGRSVFANSMQPLPAEDKRRTLRLQEYECRKSTFGVPGGSSGGSKTPIIVNRKHDPKNTDSFWEV